VKTSNLTKEICNFTSSISCSVVVLTVHATHRDAGSGQMTPAACNHHRGLQRCTARNAARKIAACPKASTSSAGNI
jgi:hypothetical protein